MAAGNRDKETGMELGAANGGGSRERAERGGVGRGGEDEAGMGGFTRDSADFCPISSFF